MLFDRDDTLIVDVPHNRDPAAVVPMLYAAEAVRRLRAADVRVAVVTNQAGIARGAVSVAEVALVNRKVDELVGAMDAWLVCPHEIDEACVCRKPQPGLVLRAAALLGVEVRSCIVIGDMLTDVEAARAAGASGILVPTSKTPSTAIPPDVLVAPTLRAAVDRILAPRSARSPA